MSASTTTPDECKPPTVRETINVPLDYEMRIEDDLDATDATAILHGSVDRAIAEYAHERFVSDCSQGVLGVFPGYTDFVDMSAVSCELAGNCFPVQGYVIAQYDPESLTPTEASAAVFRTIAAGMANNVARNDPTGIPGIPTREGVTLGMQGDTYVGGVRSQDMSNGNPGGIPGMSPGGKFGISLLFISLFALLVAAAVRHKRRREAWKEEEEYDAHDDLAFDANGGAGSGSGSDAATTKASMMKEIDDVIAGLDRCKVDVEALKALKSVTRLLGSLRKSELDGVAERARDLVAKWKRILAREEEEQARLESRRRAAAAEKSAARPPD